MRKINHVTRSVLAGSAAVALALGAAACSSDGGGGSSKKASGASKSAPAKASSSPSMAMDKPFGPACSGVPKSGAGSFSGMAKDPVATAASHNPALSTLTAAVKKAGLVDTLNNLPNATVFAPTNDAFKKIPKAQLDKVMGDKAALTKLLTYHVVPKRLAPMQLDSGTFATVEKQNVMTKGSGTDYTVNSSSKVVCGNVKTSNAAVYIVDTVLMPPKS